MTATRARERVVFPKNWTFDLADELVDDIKAEFDPVVAVTELAPKVAGKPVAEAKQIAEKFFADYGQRWMDRTIELGNVHRDRAYEALLAAVEKTGEMGFPFIPERFVEIAYLSTQPIYSLPIVEATKQAFGFKIVFCDTMNALREKCGDELADQLPCRQACLTASNRAFTAHGFQVEATQEANLVSDEFCQFRFARKDA
jgi:hypothetical protein